ncbi:hypothetical protein [Tessaracoccus coleopterorum]|uniref:hypothetical protein n=1 Tax=Tessaracoccus coleopterorum TaxID=2714950 RepID=UPI0018D45883
MVDGVTCGVFGWFPTRPWCWPPPTCWEATVPEIPIAATGSLLRFCEAGMLRLIDFHLARRLGQLADEADPDVVLACALAVRELRLGSVCVDLATASARLQPEADLDDGTGTATVDLAWPERDGWLARVAASPAVGTAGLVEAPSGWTARCSTSTATGGRNGRWPTCSGNAATPRATRSAPPSAPTSGWTPTSARRWLQRSRTRRR